MAQWQRILRWGCLLCFVGLVTGCHTMLHTELPASEYEEFTALPASKRIMNVVHIKWEVREDAAEYCAKTMRDRSPGREQAFAIPPMACAVWYVPQKECTIVTSPKVTHTVLGHEVRHCFEGHFH